MVDRQAFWVFYLLTREEKPKPLTEQENFASSSLPQKSEVRSETAFAPSHPAAKPEQSQAYGATLIGRLWWEKCCWGRHEHCRLAIVECDSGLLGHWWGEFDRA